MNRIGIFIALFLGLNLSAQKYITKTGQTGFKASVDAFEPVEAKNESTTAILNTENGEVAALLFIRAFHFKVALMEEHFNENYMDSDEFPKAKFTGILDGFAIGDLSKEAKEYKLNGSLTVKGETKDVETVANISMLDHKILLDASFEVEPGDFNIEIPGIVKEKIAKSIIIQANYELEQKK